MGYYQSTYFGFGALIAENAYQHMDLIEDFELGGRHSTLLRVNDVGYLMAGNYDQDKLFLTTHCQSVAMGKYMRVNPDAMGLEEGLWRDTLAHVASVIGMPLLETPAWFCITDLS